jgi:hypothetical protein
MLDEFETWYYINNFFGYGNWDSEFWFVGIEEGGGDIFELVNDKITSFNFNGYSHEALLDNYDFQVNNINPPNDQIALNFIAALHDDCDVNLQRYWSKMIRLLLGINGCANDNESIRCFQAHHWGRITSKIKHAVIELMPLPSPRTNDWLYNHWTAHFTGQHVPHLDTRLTYMNLFCNYRIDLLRNKIQKHKPKLIVFSGKSNYQYYNQITDTIETNWDLVQIGNFNVSFYCKKGTLFVKTSAPNTRGLTNQYWDIVIAEIINRLNICKSK